MTDEMKPSRDIAVLLELMKRLREFCPWDKVQTFDTIAPYTIEEAYEVASAIADRDFDALPGELGDLLFQVVFHARMAEEESRFDFGAVVEAVTAKMIRRRPHVFGNDEAKADAASRKDFTKGLKESERAAASQTSLLDDVAECPAHADPEPKSSSAARLLSRLWLRNNPTHVLDKIAEEAREVLDAQNGTSARMRSAICCFAPLGFGI